MQRGTLLSEITSLQCLLQVSCIYYGKSSFFSWGVDAFSLLLCMVRLLPLHRPCQGGTCPSPHINTCSSRSKAHPEIFHYFVRKSDTSLRNLPEKRTVLSGSCMYIKLISLKHQETSSEFLNNKRKMRITAWILYWGFLF